MKNLAKLFFWDALLLWFLFPLKICFAASFSIPESELFALQDLYTSTNGSGWSWQNITNCGSIWDFSQPDPNPCVQNWQGLTCLVNRSSNSSNIETISLSSYNMVGTLPESIGNLTKLVEIDLSQNNIAGTLPITIQSWPNLSILNIADCQLEGPVPDVFNAMPNITCIQLTGNALTGSLPLTASQCTLLEVFDLSYNSLNGSIPAGYFSSLVALQYFYVDDNKLTGSIPDEFTNLTSLIEVDLGENQLTGFFPYSLCASKGLEGLYLTTNYLHGSLVDCLSELIHLGVFAVGHNDLTGSIPPRLGALTNLLILGLNDNSFTNSLVSDLGENMTDLLLLYLAQNQFTGTLPTVGSVNLTVVNLYSNYFYGTITSHIGKSSRLAALYVDQNLFSGQLPETMSQLSQLTILLTKSNLFTGPLTNIFNPAVQTVLGVVDMSYNQFSGTLPATLFSLPAAKTIAAISNCLHGSIPLEVCNVITIETLALDGLMSSSACQNRLFSTLTNAYSIKYQVSGGIPACLFALPHLSTLHLSGNGLTGSVSLPYNNALSPSLSDLSLSYNRLVGTIPLAVQQHHWTNVDLSHNRLDGTLTSSFPAVAANASLFLQVNRLSGVIPSSLTSAINISILDGNMFGCPYDHSGLPQHDNNVDNYQCGSNSFELSLYVWLMVAVLGVCLLAWLYFRSTIGSESSKSIDGTGIDSGHGDEQSLRLTSVTPVYFEWMWLFDILPLWVEKYVGPSQQVQHYKTTSTVLTLVSHVLNGVRRVTLFLTAVVVGILLPTYAVLNVFYRTYSYEYLWIISAVYVSGIIAFIVLSIVFAMVCALGWISWRRDGAHIDLYSQKMITSTIKKDQLSPSSLSFDETAQKSLPVSLWLLFAVILVVNASVVLTVNIAYVYYYHSNKTSAAAVLLLQVVVAGFKIVWNNIVVPSLLRWYFLLSTLARGNTQDYTLERRMRVLTRRTAIEIIIALFNNVAVSFMAAALISSNCFSAVVFSTDPVVSSYSFDFCFIANAGGFQYECVEYITTTKQTSYTPPFIYNYQCSSAIITTFANIYVYMYLAITFLLPLLHLAVKVLNESWNSGKSAEQKSLCGRLVSSLTPMLCKPLDLLISQASQADNTIQYESLTRVQAGMLLFSRGNVRDKLNLFDSYQIVVQVVQGYSVLFTFGVFVPPIAVIICLAMWVQSIWFQMWLGRLIAACLKRDTAESRQCLTALEEEYSRIPSLLIGSAYIVVPLVLVFYSMLLFDTLGDAVGYGIAIWVPITVLCVPILVRFGVLSHRWWVNWQLRRQFNEKKKTNSNKQEEATGRSSQDLALSKLSGAGLADQEQD